KRRVCTVIFLQPRLGWTRNCAERHMVTVLWRSGNPSAVGACCPAISGRPITWHSHLLVGASSRRRFSQNVLSDTLGRVTDLEIYYCKHRAQQNKATPMLCRRIRKPPTRRTSSPRFRTETFFKINSPQLSQNTCTTALSRLRLETS